MNATQFMAGQPVYVIYKQDRPSKFGVSGIAEYIFVEYSKDQPGFAVLSFLHAETHTAHTITIRTACMYPTRSMAERQYRSMPRAKAERKRKAYVAPKRWDARKIDYKRLNDASVQRIFNA